METRQAGNPSGLAVANIDNYHYILILIANKLPVLLSKQKQKTLVLKNMVKVCS